MIPRLLILTPHETLAQFQEDVNSRTMLWGLDAQGIDWELHQPWKERRDLDGFSAVLAWTYGHKERSGFIADCLAFEERCRAAGVLVVNSVRDWSTRHSFFLERWRDRGVRCARFQKFSSIEEIELPFPLILRRDGHHMGREMFLVPSAGEARRLMEAREAEGAGPLDLAVEFVDTRDAEGYYSKWRAYVVGERVLPGHMLRSRLPLVNFRDAFLDARSCRLDREYMAATPDDPEAIRAAARATGYEIVAVDYGRLPNGEHVFWEANRNFATAGDRVLGWLTVRPGDLEHGTAVAHLVLERIAAGAAAASGAVVS